jgi:FixJ family two-component response regulator
LELERRRVEVGMAVPQVGCEGLQDRDRQRSLAVGERRKRGDANGKSSNFIRGKSNKAVANVLGSTERTIKAHHHRVMEEMQV